MSPILTPFSNDEKVDTGYYNEYFHWLKENQVQDIFVFGTYGAGVLLSYSEKKKLIEAVSKECSAFGINAIINIGSPCINETINLAKHVENISTHSICSTVPYYHSNSGYYTFDHIYRFFDRILKNTELPVYLYNNPRTTGILVQSNEFVELVKNGLHGVKDGSHADDSWAKKTSDLLNKEKKDAEIIFGNTKQLEFIHDNDKINTVISGVSILFPQLLVDAVNDLNNGDYRLYKLIQRIRKKIAKHGSFPQIAYSILKQSNHTPELGSARIPWLELQQSSINSIIEELNVELEGTPYKI
jgi:N-acetylneuraminate lyase/4-hydroxy-tetrahydrodipicolinate synthase